LQNARKNLRPEETSETPGKDEQDNDLISGAESDQGSPVRACCGEPCVRRCRTLPEIAELSKHILFTETKEGLNLEIVDQDGRSMFPEGSEGAL
jgi:chemotaxis protein MotB